MRVTPVLTLVIAMLAPPFAGAAVPVDPDLDLRASLSRTLSSTGQVPDGAALDRIVAAVTASRARRWATAAYRAELTSPVDIAGAGYDPALVGRVVLVSDANILADAIAIAYASDGRSTNHVRRADAHLVGYLRRHGLRLTRNDVVPDATPEAQPSLASAGTARQAACAADPGTLDPGAWFHRDCIDSLAVTRINQVEILFAVGRADVNRLLDGGEREVQFWSIDPRQPPCSDRRRRVAAAPLARDTDVVEVGTSGPDEGALMVAAVGRSSYERDAAACLSLPLDCYRLSELDEALSTATDPADRVALVQGFLADVGLSDGFPVRCGGTSTFFFERPAGFGAPSVVGEFNGWDPAAGRMSLVEGSWYRASQPVDPAATWQMYKITDGASWVGDPQSRRFGYDGYGEYSLVSGSPDRSHLERYRAISGAGLGPRDLTVYLPPGYVTGASSYPVLYAHDGQNLFDPGAPWGGWHLDQAIEALLAEGSIAPLVVVGIHNTPARMDEYTHVPDLLGTEVGGRADAYFDLIVSRIMPLVASHYRVRTGPASTSSLGSSLGGVAALYFGMKHPDVFGRVAGMSPTAGWGSIGAHNQTLIELLPTLGSPDAVFYLDSGGSDGGAPGCVDADADGIEDDAPAASDNYCETLQLRDVFEAAGYVPGVDLVYAWEPGASHTEAAWAARVAQPLRVLSPPVP